MPFGVTRPKSIVFITFFILTIAIRLNAATLLIDSKMAATPSGVASDLPVLPQFTKSSDFYSYIGRSGASKGLVRVSQFMDKVLNGIPLQTRAQVDLLVFEDKDVQRLVPRYLVSKSGLALGIVSDSASLRFSVTVPAADRVASSVLVQSRIPVTLFEERKYEFVRLANSDQIFADLKLKHVKDPSTLRGERIMRESCVFCHTAFLGRDGSVAGTNIPSPSITNGTLDHGRETADAKSPSVTVETAHVQASPSASAIPERLAFTGFSKVATQLSAMTSHRQVASLPVYDKKDFASIRKYFEAWTKER